MLRTDYEQTSLFMNNFNKKTRKKDFSYEYKQSPKERFL